MGLRLEQSGSALRRGVLTSTTLVIALSVLWALAGPGKALAQTAAPAKRPAAAKPPPEGYAVEPTPSWALPLAVDQALAAQLPRAPLHVLLDDMQTRLDRNEQSQYVHVVRQVNESGGLETGSQIQIDFDPSYQSLALNTLAIWRNGTRIDKMPTRRVQLLHRESQLERQMIDGRRTASIVLDDLRVGDRVEFAYTRRGSNPVFEGRFVDVESTINSRGPTALVRYRLLAPSSRDVRLRADPARHEVTSREQAGWRETLIRRVNVPQYQHDPYIPPSVYMTDTIQFSEFADWADVARWSARVFSVAAGAPSAAVRTEAERLAGLAGAEPAERVRRTLDFVQTEVRYFGTEMGANSHRPADPDQVLKQRFGDCKDKATLLAALLKAQGIATTPVLVSTLFRSEALDLLPSPLAFNHVIARVEVDGGLLLDATRSRQTGPLSERQARGLGFGLPTEANATALAALPDSRDTVHIEGDDRVVFTRLADDPLLDAQLTYHGDSAEGLRHAVDSQPLAELEKHYAGEYARHYPGAEIAEPIKVEEIAGHNSVRVHLKFKLSNYLHLPEDKQLSGDFGLPTIINELRLPDQAPRKLPMRIGQPGIYRHAVEFRFPEAVYSREERAPFDHVGQVFELHGMVDGARSSARFSSELRILKERLEPADWQAHRDLLLKLWPRISSTVNIPTLSPAQATSLMEKLKSPEASQYKLEAQQSAQAKLWILQARLDSDRLPARPRVLMAALALSPSSSPSTTPAASAITFFAAAHSSTPTRSGLT